MPKNNWFMEEIMNTIDMVIILIILIFMLIGSLRGFISSIIGLIEYAFSIFLAYKCAPVFANFMIEKWAINERISSAIHSVLIPKITENVINNSQEYQGMLEASGQSMESIKESLAATELPFLDAITEKIVFVLAIIILFVAFKFLFRIVRFVLNRIATLPVLKEFNKIGGMIVGFVEGVIISLIVIAGITLVPNEELQNSLNESFIGNKVSQAVVNIVLSSIDTI